MVDGEDVVSEIRNRPGPTDTFFDLLAAAIGALAPGPRVLMLGFAGGGIVAPLRALGFAAPIVAVDLSRNGHSLFRELCGAWAGRVVFHRAEASAWLREHRARFDLILDDLAVPSPIGMTKPPVSYSALPRSIARHLRPGGIAVTNVLPVPGMSWSRLLGLLAEPWPRAMVVQTIEYENRLLIAGDSPRGAARVSRELRTALRSIGSLQADRIAVRTLAASRRALG